MKQLAVIIVVLAIAAVFLLPTIMQAISDFIEFGLDFDMGFEDDTLNGNGDLPGVNDDEPTNQGQLCMGVTVKFKDGTEKSVDPEDLPLTVFPLTVYFESKEISEIHFFCNLLVDWTGQLNSLEIDGWMQTELAEPYGNRLELMQIHKVYSSGQIPRNEWIGVTGMIVTAQDVYTLVAYGDHAIRGSTYLEVTAVFSRMTDKKTATAYTDIPVTVQEEALTVFSIQVQPQILTP